MEQGIVVSPCDWLHREIEASVADPHHFDADPDSTFHLDADLDPSFHIKAQNLEKVKKCSNRLSYSIHFGLSSAPPRIRIRRQLINESGISLSL
jgi:hypothetical protein